jgi:hypothetical protein
MVLLKRSPKASTGDRPVKAKASLAAQGALRTTFRQEQKTVPRRWRSQQGSTILKKMLSQPCSRALLASRHCLQRAKLISHDL